MKVLWISHLLPYPPVGGVRIRSYNLIREVSKYSDVHFVGLSQKAHQPSEDAYIEANKAIEAICNTVKISKFESYKNFTGWVLLVVRSFFSRKSYKENWAKSKSMERSILEVIENYDIDVVHFDTISLLQYKRLIPSEIPVVINHHNIESAMLYRRSKNNLNIIKKLFFYCEALKVEKLEKKYISDVTNVVVSELDVKRINSLSEELNVHVVPNGVDLQYFSPVSADYIHKSLVWVGGLTWYPNLDAVMYFCKEVWPLLVAKENDARLYIVGRNPPEHLKRFAAVNPNVELLGFVDDIRPIMSSVSACICPIRDGGGTRLKVLNTMALGVPLIATSMACEGVPVKDGVNVLLAENCYEFVDKISSIFQDESLRIKLAFNSRKLIVENFDFTVIGKKLNSVYLNLL